MTQPEATVAAAAIAAAASLVVAFLNYRGRHPSRYAKSRAARRFAGKWFGELSSIGAIGQAEDPQSATVSLKLKAKGKLVVGSATIHYGDDLSSSLTLIGGVFYDQHAILEGKGDSELRMQFGSAALTISCDGTSMDGIFSGFGFKSQKMVAGLVSLKRQHD